MQRDIVESFRMEREAELVRGTSSRGLIERLPTWRDRGLTQQQAAEALQAMREGKDEAVEERVLDALGVVTGRCSLRHRVW